MKTRIIYLFAFLLGSFSQLMAQTTIMNIHRKNASAARFPVQRIDTITYSVSNISKPGSGVTFNNYTYPSIVLGNSQEWMAENLKTTTYNDGTEIPTITNAGEWSTLNTPAYCFHGNNLEINGKTYGALYNWYTVNTGKLCPTGWHVPTYAEWTALTDYLGGINVAGGKLKKTGTTLWKDPNIATNETGFSGLPGGARSDNGSFIDIGEYGHYWSSSEFQPNVFVEYRLMYQDIGIIPTPAGPQFGLSVRCLKN